MAERVYPSNRPGVQNLNGVYTKGQMYGATLPTFRPTPLKRCRNRCCLFFLCLIVFLLVLILVAGIVALVLWVIYSPHQPSFTVNSVQIPKFNVTKDSHLNYEFDLEMDARDPQGKLTVQTFSA